MKKNIRVYISIVYIKNFGLLFYFNMGLLYYFNIQLFNIKGVYLRKEYNLYCFFKDFLKILL